MTAKSTPRVKKYREKAPWSRSLEFARRRCNDKNHYSYQWYGAKGIRCLLTIEEVKILWIRDRAHYMKRPSLDRIDPNEHYYMENCRFIEYHENAAKYVSPVKDLTEWEE